MEGRFDGGSMTSDGGVMLLGEVDRKLGLLEAASRCIADPRSPMLIKHGVRDMLRQRVYGLALGWEDLNDHGALRRDVAMQTAVGVDCEVASAPTLCRLEKWADRASAWRLHEVLVDQFIASFRAAPEELVLDFDATDNPLHGQQEGRFFHGYYDCYCYLPLYVFCGQQLLCAYLRPSRIDGAKHAAAILKLLVKRLRQKWPPGAHRVSRRLGLLPATHHQLVRASRGALHHWSGAQRATAADDRIGRTGHEGCLPAQWP